YFPVKRGGADAREALDEAQVLARAPEFALGGEIGSLDDQGVSFPPPARIAVPLPDARIEMRWSVNRNDAGVVDHLAQNHDMSRRLKDLIVAVVTRKHPWYTCEPALGHTPLVARPVFGSVGRVVLAIFGSRRLPLDGVGSHRRNSAV